MTRHDLIGLTTNIGVFEEVKGAEDDVAVDKVPAAEVLGVKVPPSVAHGQKGC